MRHSRHYAAKLEGMRSDLAGEGQSAALDRIEVDIGNVRAAWRWAAKHRMLPEIDQVVHSLYRFYLVRGSFKEGKTEFGDASESFKHHMEA
jgi:hypothetical protein